MEDLLIDLGVSALLRAIKNPAKQRQFFKAMAKVYVAVERLAAINPELTRLIREKRGDGAE